MRCETLDPVYAFARVGRFTVFADGSCFQSRFWPGNGQHAGLNISLRISAVSLETWGGGAIPRPALHDTRKLRSGTHDGREWEWKATGDYKVKGIHRYNGGRLKAPRGRWGARQLHARGGEHALITGCRSRVSRR